MGRQALDMGAATRLYWTFKVYGEDRLAVLDGGAAGWLAEGREVSLEDCVEQVGKFFVVE